MPIQVGQRVPDGTLSEFIEQETPGCTLGPNNFDVSKLVAGKRIAVFGLPGAFTPTCSAKHVPSYLANAGELAALAMKHAIVERDVAHLFWSGEEWHRAVEIRIGRVSE